MGQQMQFSVSDAEQIVSKLATSSGEMQDVQTSLTNSINETTKWWVGNAGDAFMAQYEEFKPSLVELENLIADLSDQMKKIADVMVKYDEEGAKRYR